MTGHPLRLEVLSSFQLDLLAPGEHGWGSLAGADEPKHANGHNIERIPRNSRLKGGTGTDCGI